MEIDVVEKLRGLLVQKSDERSDYNINSALREAISEISQLRQELVEKKRLLVPASFKARI